MSQGKVITVENFQEIFAGILNAKDLEGVRLLVTQFPQQQFNATADRKTVTPTGMQGVACFDCHVNGHTSGATHLAGDIRPQSHRRRIDTPSLRGVNIQRLFGSQRALKSIEDFTEFEQRAAYFDGDQVSAAAKGVNPLERGSQVHFMSEFQELLDFPPAPGLNVFGKLDAGKFAADSPEMRGQKLFFGKAQCAVCHPAPYYTDNLMHDLKVDRFYKTQTINGLVATSQGPIKTFPLRGIKESPPYLPRRPIAHARRHRGVLQPDPRAEIERLRKRLISWRSCGNCDSAADDSPDASVPSASFLLTRIDRDRRRVVLVFNRQSRGERLEDVADHAVGQ